MRKLPATAVEQLRALGQSVWIDDLTRGMITGGQLAALRDQGVTGITANPTTFDRAVTGSDLYDSHIRRLAVNHGVAGILWELQVEDVRRAADLFRPDYERTAGADGYVSIEVPPDIAYDTERTVAKARELWRRCGRPNVMIKIPATEPGLPAIRRMLAEGVNVNVTLTFSVGRYAEVVESFLAGLEQRLDAGLPVDHLASVASFFVSRVDTKVDGVIRRRLEEAHGPAERDVLESLLGKIGIANSKLAYQRFRQFHSGPRWETLAVSGARAQRCLWASTSVKDPAYPATMYVEALAGPETVDTMPVETFQGLADARIEGNGLERDVELAHDQIKRLAVAGIDLDRVTDELETEGVRAFEDSYLDLLTKIDEKVSSRGWNRVHSASEGSFPASDAPGWGGHAIGGPPAGEEEERRPW
jgi:transaldolase